MTRRHAPRSLWFATILAAGWSIHCGLPEGEYFGHVAARPDPTHFRWCNAGEPEFLDPALVTRTTGVPLAYTLFDGLTDHNEQGLPEPSLAVSWDISPDQRRFTFHLHTRGRWSNGRPITAHDFAFHIERMLSPLSFSRNAEPLWKLKNGALYTEARVKQVRRDVGPFRAGNVVEVIGDALPNSNMRTSDQPLRLRDQYAPERDAYAIVPAGEEVTIVDLDGLDDAWAYVHWADGDGVFGWVKTETLTGQPHADVVYRVRRVPAPHRIGVDIAITDIEAALTARQVEGDVRGADLLMLPDVLGVRVLGDYTLELETWGPVPYLIDMTPQQPFRATPREVVSRWPLRWTRPEHIVTSGPFHLRAWHERDRLEMVKSPTYWRSEQVRFERFTAYSIDDQAASTNFYMQGGCDATATNHVPASYYPALNGEKRGTAYKDFIAAPYLGTYFYIINTEKISNVHLRRALSHAIDRTAIPRILHGQQIPSAQYMPGTPIRDLSDEDLALCGVTRDTPGVAMIVMSGELCYVPPPGLGFDLDKARRQLDLARQQLGKEFPRKISLKFNIGNESHKLIAEYIQHEWQQKLGITAELSSQEWRTYLKATNSGDYEIGRFGNIGNFPDPESEFLSIFKCDAPNNRTRMCDDEFERLFKQAEAISNRKQRLAVIRQAEQVLVDQAPIIPLFVYAQVQLQKPYVKNLPVNPSYKQPYYKAWIDPDWRANLAGEQSAAEQSAAEQSAAEQSAAEQSAAEQNRAEPGAARSGRGE